VQHFSFTDNEKDLRGYRGGFFADSEAGDCFVYNLTIPTNETLRNNGTGWVNYTHAEVIAFRQPRALWTPSPLPTPDYVEWLDLMLSNSSFNEPYTGNYTTPTIKARYAYFVPYHNGSDFHGKVVRVVADTNMFEDLDEDGCSMQILNLTEIDTHYRGFNGGFVHKQHGYLVPFRHNETSFSGTLVRFDTNRFDNATVESLDLTRVDPRLRGFQGGHSTAGEDVYLFPYLNSAGPVYGSGVSETTWHGHDDQAVDGDRSRLGLFAEADYTDPLFYPNHHLAHKAHSQLRPHYHGMLVKVTPLDAPLFNESEVSFLDLTQVDDDLRGFSGGFQAGQYLYLVPYMTGKAEMAGFSGKVARVDLNNFTPSGVSILDLTLTDLDLRGFVGGFAAGKYGYFVPYKNGQSASSVYGPSRSITSGKVARVDLSDFSTVHVIDLPTSERAQIPRRFLPLSHLPDRPASFFRPLATFLPPSFARRAGAYNSPTCQVRHRATRICGRLRGGSIWLFCPALQRPKALWKDCKVPLLCPKGWKHTHRQGGREGGGSLSVFLLEKMVIL
jgi:hypothetical protein